MSRFRYAFSTLGCPDWPIDRMIAAAQQYGYEGLELRVLNGKVVDPVEDRAAIYAAVERCREHGIAVPVFATSCRFNRPDAAERADTIASLHTWIALAHELSVPLLRVFGGAAVPGAPQPAPEQEDAWVIEGLRAIAPAARAASTTIVLETHDAYASARRVAEVLTQVDAPQIAALWDSHHPYRVGETADDVVAALGARIAHVHVKDARRVTDDAAEWQLVLLGEGEVPVRAQLDALTHLGYDGWVSVEWEKMWHPTLAEPDSALPQHRAWLRAADEARA